MQISKHKVVTIHYTLKDNEGNLIDTSQGGAPLTYLHGVGNLIPGMEKGLEGKTKGEKLDLKVSPEEGYGTRQDEMIQKIPRAAFGNQQVEVGMQFSTGQGHQTVTVVEVGTDTITVDANHALAGVELNFAVEIIGIREASADEISHGHVHGAGGHHH